MSNEINNLKAKIMIQEKKYLKSKGLIYDKVMNGLIYLFIFYSFKVLIVLLSGTIIIGR